MLRTFPPTAVLLLGLAACGEKPAAVPPAPPPPEPAASAPAPAAGEAAALPPGVDASTPEHLRPGPQPAVPPPSATLANTTFIVSEIKPVRMQLTSLSQALNQAEAQRQAEINRRMATHLQAADRISALQRRADAARDAGHEEESAQLRQQADDLQAKQATWAPPLPPDRTKADLAFDQLLQRFRQQVKANQGEDARATLQQMLDIATRVSPAVLQALDNDLKVLEERGGHY